MFSVNFIVHLACFFIFIIAIFVIAKIKKQRDFLRKLIKYKTSPAFVVDWPLVAIQRFSLALGLEFDTQLPLRRGVLTRISLEPLLQVVMLAGIKALSCEKIGQNILLIIETDRILFDKDKSEMELKRSLQLDVQILDPK